MPKSMWAELLGATSPFEEYVVWSKWRMANVIWWEMWAAPKRGEYLTSFDKQSWEQDRNAWTKWRNHAACC